MFDEYEVLVPPVLGLVTIFEAELEGTSELTSSCVVSPQHPV